jgi:BTB/POZ domain
MASTMVRLNVGGTLFATTLHTLKCAGEDSFLAALVRQIEAGEAGPAGASDSAVFGVVRDDSGAVFIDREGLLFRPILHFLRTGRWTPELADPCPAAELKRECDFFGVDLPHEVSVSDASLMRVISEARSGEIDKAGAGLERLCETVARAFLLNAEKDAEMTIHLYPCVDVCIQRISASSEYRAALTSDSPNLHSDAKDYQGDLEKFFSTFGTTGACSGEEIAAYEKAGSAVLLRALRERYGLTAEAVEENLRLERSLAYNIPPLSCYKLSTSSMYYQSYRFIKISIPILHLTWRPVEGFATH